MQRNLVQIARIQMREVVPGDIVNRVPDDTRGWFVASIVEELFDGNLQVANAARTMAFSAGPLDIIGVQHLKSIDLPAAGEPEETVDELERSTEVEKGSKSKGSAEAEKGSEPGEAAEVEKGSASTDARDEGTEPDAPAPERPTNGIAVPSARPDPAPSTPTPAMARRRAEAAPPARRSMRDLLEG